MTKKDRLNTLYNARCCIIWLKTVEKSKHKCLINKTLKNIEKIIEDLKKET